jgi:16S rRNA (cytosine1402-N4)-methyltransferase
MAVNDEMRAVEDLIKSLPNVLVSSESRVSVITFHSTEDRIVKIAVKENENLEFVNKKVIEPSENEIKENIRSRSAKLRVIKLKND